MGLIDDMEDILLRSFILTIVRINRKTKAKMFCNLKVGDSIQCSVKIEAVGRTKSGPYAAYITIENVETGETTQSSFNQLPTILRAFGFDYTF